MHQYIIVLKIDGIIRGNWTQSRSDGLRQTETVAIGQVCGKMQTGAATKRGPMSMYFERLPPPEDRPTYVAASQRIAEPGCVEISIWLRKKSAPKFTVMKARMEYLVDPIPTRSLEPKATGELDPSLFIRFNHRKLPTGKCMPTTPKAGWDSEDSNSSPREPPWMTFRYLYRDKGKT